MTTANITAAAPHSPGHFEFPDPPEREPDDRTSFDHMTGLRYADLLIAFDVNPAAFHRSNACVISKQGKPPDFALEIASQRTGHEDVTYKRDDYAALGILEYRRFDETGRYHGARLAGDRLVDGRYETIGISELDDFESCKSNSSGYAATDPSLL